MSRVKSGLFGGLILVVVLGTGLAGSTAEVQRKAKLKVPPQYPEIAKKMNISGAVKLEVLISSTGAVKSVKPLGGHPLLIDAAISAVKQWKYEPGEEGTEIVEFHFSPNQQ